MFDRALLGLYGLDLPCDLAGQVPEAGDSPEAFAWEPDRTWTPEAWQDFVQQAIAATDEAMTRMEQGRFLFRRRR